MKITNSFKIGLLVFCCSNVALVIGTEVKWTGNPDGPEAARVPRSQKYWDENNIERPDYAKTDAEIRQERRQQNKGSDSLGLNKETKGYKGFQIAAIIAFFLGLWTLIFRTALTGNRLGSSSETDNKKFTFGKPSVLGGTENLEEKARLARLAKFENKEN
jgi:hypothetical protein